MLQQCLPLAVLKPSTVVLYIVAILLVATVLTACGIETHMIVPEHMQKAIELQQCLPLAVLKRYNI